MTVKLKRSPTQLLTAASSKQSSMAGKGVTTGTAQRVVKRSFRKHQYKMFQYALKERHPFLAVEMRLGKNLVTIRRCLLYKPLDPAAGLRILIIAPNSALGAWEDELEKEEQQYTTLSGTTREKLAQLRGVNRCFTLTNKESFLYLPEIATAQNWDAVVWDETVWIANPKSKITKYFLRNFRDCPHRWALCGLPNPESILQLWCQLAWLDGHAFGFRDYWRHRAKCFYQKGFDWSPREGVEDFIKSRFGSRACIIRRRDEGVEPVTSASVRAIELSPTDRKTYDRMEADFEDTQGATTVWVTVKYQWLRQFCSTMKLEELVTLLTTDLKADPIVVWFHYNRDITLVRAALNKVNVTCAQITGEDSRQARDVRRKLWINGAYRVLLVQQAVAQEGMDLSHADTAVYFSETPSSKAMRQTADRIVSLNKKTSLLYVFLVVKNTVDSDLHTALAAKHLKSDLELSKAIKLGIQARRAQYVANRRKK